MANEALNDPFNPDRPFFDVWPDYNDEPKSELKIVIHGEPKMGRTEFVRGWADGSVILESPSEAQERIIKEQADLYTRAHFRDGNLKSSKRHTRKNKKMAKRRNRDR